MNECKNWLEKLLTDYERMPISIIRNEAKKFGWFKKDLKQARRELKISSGQEPSGTWYWELLNLDNG